MSPFPLAERLVYALVILLALIAIGLVIASPSVYTETRVIYQAF